MSDQFMQSKASSESTHDLTPNEENLIEIPKFLYHYTTLDSLACILQSRTIRLLPLDMLDDHQEKESADLKRAGQFIFVSCWTDDDTESIPMWKMYTDTASGVRIRLKTNPFFWFDADSTDVHQLFGALSTRIDEIGPVRTLIPIDQMIRTGCYSHQFIWAGYGARCPPTLLQKIEYTRDTSKLVPRLMEHVDTDVILTLSLGRYKNEAWRFQSEWRYLIGVIPQIPAISLTNSGKPYDYLMANIALDRVISPIRELFLNISEEFFSEMEITASPTLTKGNRIILEHLLAAYNPHAVLRNSELEETL